MDLLKPVGAKDQQDRQDQDRNDTISREEQAHEHGRKYHSQNHTNQEDYQCDLIATF